MTAGVPVRLIMSSIHMTRRESWEAQLRWAKAQGFWGVEVFGEDLVTGNLTGPFAQDALRDTANRFGLALTAHPWFDWARDEIGESTARLRGLLDRCRKLNVKMINLHLNFLAGPADGCGHAAKIIRPLLNDLEVDGQELYFENVPGSLENPLGSKPEEFSTFFALLAHHPRIGFNLDVGHAHITGNLARFIDELRGQWRYTHLHDNSGSADEHLVPGKGTVDWPGFVREAAQYRGPFVLEFPERYLPNGAEILAPLFTDCGREWPPPTSKLRRG